MKASILLIAASAGATLAHAASIVERGDSICPDASYYLPLCCFTAFLGPEELLDCRHHSIDGSVKDFSDFKKSCREVGGAAVKCCNIPFAGEPQLCEDPVRI
ncbi:hypothetical protein AAEP93_009458 [Penicillium crustosum]